MFRGTFFLMLILVSSASLALLYSPTPTRVLVVGSIYGLGTGLTLFLLFHPRSQWLVANRSQVSGAGCVALTFDDGPDPVYTPRLLDLLKEKDVKATFFVVGKRADAHPEIVRRAWEEGHLIANHTWSHPNLFCFLTPGRLRAEMERGRDSVHASCGFRTSYFRSPVGLRHPLLALNLKRMGLEFISWQVRSLDTVIGSSAKLARRVLNRVTPGDIILLHDRLPAGTDAMLSALPGMIDELRARGLRFVLVGPRDEVPTSGISHAEVAR